MIRYVVLSAISILLLTSCRWFGEEKIRGNGTLKSETRAVANFSSVKVGGSIDVYLKQDSAFSVKVETDENLLEYITIKVEGDKLVIEPKPHTNLSGSNDIKVFVSAPVFNNLDVSGASSVTSEAQLSSESIDIDVTGASSANLDVRSPKVSAEITGASNIELRGQTKDLVIDATGASQAKCYNLLTENADIEATGASSAEVFASVSVKADATGASHIRYKGATSHAGSASGAGSITKVD